MKRLIRGPRKEWRAEELWLYLRYVATVALVIACAFTFQLLFVYSEFSAKMVLAPTVVTLFIGIMLGRNAILKQRLERKNEQFRAVADLAEEFTFLRRNDGNFDYISPAFRTITGYRPEELMARPGLLDELIHGDDRPVWQRHLAQLRNTGMPQSTDLRLIHHNGDTVWISHTAVPVYDQHKQSVIGIRATSLDITQRKRYEEHIERQAHYDLLTELPNRRLMMLHMEELIAACAEAPRRFALLFLDLDRFKYLNDSRGHTFGDQLLKVLGKRLSEAMPETSIVSRFGGDEFVILVPDIASAAEASRHAYELLEIVEQPLLLEGVEYSLSASIGIALHPEDGGDADTLIRNADAAMYRSKRGMHGKVQRYTPSIVTEAASFVTMEGQLRKGLRLGEFIPHYQAKISLESGAVIGYEALARWQHSDGTLGVPDQFIPVAVETGMIRELGEHMLELVCRQLRDWQGVGRQRPVAVNVAAHHFAEQGFVENIERLLEMYGIEPSLLELEITEQSMIGDIQEAIKRLHALRAMGIRIALDDFGTGYSSLNYLCQLPIDQVKIDRSFVNAAQLGGKELAMLRNIIVLCSELQLEIIAEGIETATHLEMLRDLGCRVGQGYFFHRPMAARELSVVH